MQGGAGEEDQPGSGRFMCKPLSVIPSVLAAVVLLRSHLEMLMVLYLTQDLSFIFGSAEIIIN